MGDPLRCLESPNSPMVTHFIHFLVYPPLTIEGGKERDINMCLCLEHERSASHIGQCIKHEGEITPPRAYYSPTLTISLEDVSIYGAVMGALLQRWENHEGRWP